MYHIKVIFPCAFDSDCTSRTSLLSVPHEYDISIFSLDISSKNEHVRIVDVTTINYSIIFATFTQTTEKDLS
jgi:hypothetical protein